MQARDIIEQLAKECKVERMAAKICTPPSPQVADLCQMIYTALLLKPAEQIERAYNEGWLDFKILAMLRRQWWSKDSTFRDTFDRYTRAAQDLDLNMKAYEDDYFERGQAYRDGPALQGNEARVQLRCERIQSGATEGAGNKVDN